MLQLFSKHPSFIVPIYEHYNYFFNLKIYGLRSNKQEQEQEVINICLNKGFFLNIIADKREQPQTLCSLKGLIISITIK